KIAAAYAISIQIPCCSDSIVAFGRIADDFFNSIDPKRTLNARSTVAHCRPRATWQLHSQRLAVVRPSHHALIDHLRRDPDHALARPAEAQIACRIARAKLDGLQGLALRAEREPAFSV